jgi:hypothetical protein
MSIELVENEIRRFISTKEPEVISISGHWGVGKTFAWNLYLKDAQRKDKIALKKYSYVSLFGVNSLDEFKYAVFENSVSSSDIGVEPSLDTLWSNANAATEKLIKKTLGILQQTPALQNYIGGIAPVWFSAVSETVICIDDFERRGKSLSVRDVLGLINNLKERKACKACLILNDDALEEDEGDFRKYLEKVVDTSLEFEPTPEECARIALAADTKTGKLLAENCMALGISNIRLIKRIERMVRVIEPMLQEFDEGVLRQAAQSLSLLGWSVYEPDTAPSIDYLRNLRGADLFGIDEKTEVPKKEAAWNALLDAYNFTSMDEFDLVLLSGVQKGFFDPVLVKKRASELHSKLKALNLDNSFSEAWGMYHDSLDNDQEEVLDAIYQAFFKGVKYITPLNMSSTVALFKALGRPDQAAEILNYYVETRGENRELFDLSNYPFVGNINDPDVVQAFKDKFATFKVDRDPTAILLSMSRMNGWSPEDITTLCALPVDDYRKIFNGTKGRDLRQIINACLQFDRIGNSTPEMKEISKRAKDALKLIGQESAINARRVRGYGVEATQSEPKSN